MLDIQKIDHVGIRVSDKGVSIRFYKLLGFKTLSDTGFEQGHPVIMQHPSGVVLNLLGPSNTASDQNILMDVAEKYSGLTHVSFKVASMAETKDFLEAQDIAISGSFAFKGMQAVFIRDPDKNVIELDAYVGDEPSTCTGDERDFENYREHP